MKKNQQYYKTKKRILNRHQKSADAVIACIRIVTESIMSAMQIRLAMQTPVPKFPSGGCCAEPKIKGIYYGEEGKEIIVDKHGKVTDILGGMYVPTSDSHGDIIMPGAFDKSRLSYLAKGVNNTILAHDIKKSL